MCMKFQRNIIKPLPIYFIKMAISINHTFVNLKIASLNCRGLNEKSKRILFFENFAKSDYSIICLQETKLKPEKELLYMKEWESGPSFFNSVPGGKSGTAILINTNQITVKNALNDDIGKTIAIDISVDGDSFHIINTYFPNDNREQYRYIYNLPPFFHSPFPIIWCGDHNISTNNTIDRLPSNQNKDQYGESIIEIINNFQLIDVCRKLYPNKNDIFTYTHGSTRSRIDKILVQGDCFHIKDYCHELIYQSDHELIVAHIQSNNIIEKGKGIWKNNSLLYQNECLKDEFAEFWSDLKSTYQSNCPIKFWMHAKKKVKNLFMIIGKLIAKEKNNEKKKEIERVKSLYKISGTMDNHNQELISNYLEEKKILAKKQLDDIKEKIELKKCKELFNKEKPTKCFFSKI